MSDRVPAGEERPDWRLHILGCRGTHPVCGEEYLTFGGDTSCYVLKCGARAVILDCGTGLCRAGELLRDCTRIDVLLSHVHYDHLMGLLAGDVFPGGAAVRFLAPFDNWLGADTLKRFLAPPFWPYTPRLGEIVNVPMGESVPLSEGLTLRFRPSRHPDGACLLRLDGPGWALCYASDYEHGGPFPDDLARGCTLLMYDAMNTGEEASRRMGWGHSTWRAGCELARRLDIPRLLLVHHDPARTDGELLALEVWARELLPNARFARTGDVLDLTGAAEHLALQEK